MEDWRIRCDSSWICGAEEEEWGIQASGKGKVDAGVGKMRMRVRKRQISRAKLVRRGGGSGGENRRGKQRDFFI
jgi:hypothetical protein